MSDKLNWLSVLSNIFDSYVAQDTLEEAADLLAGISSSDKLFHEAILNAFDSAIFAANKRDARVINVINANCGYKANNFDDALELLLSFKNIYLIEYKKY